MCDSGITQRKPASPSSYVIAKVRVRLRLVHGPIYLLPPTTHPFWLARHIRQAPRYTLLSCYLMHATLFRLETLWSHQTRHLSPMNRCGATGAENQLHVLSTLGRYLVLM